MDVPDLSRVEMLILSALSWHEQYGLEIVDSVKQITDGRQTLSLGGLYTTLHRMEKKGLVEARWGDTTEVRHGARRRYYTIAGLGELALVESRRALFSALTFQPSPGAMRA